MLIKEGNKVDLSVRLQDPAELITHEASQINLENPQIIRKVFDSTRDKTYNFFSRYPRLEKQLSKTVHLGWRLMAKLKFR